jgi:NADH-quinone oxidoreductase subunit C
MDSPALTKQLLECFPFLKERPSLDWPAFNVPSDQYCNLCKALRDEWGFSILVDATAIDWDQQSPRFTTVIHLYNPTQCIYLRIATDCTNDANPTVPSVSAIWPAADWHEREAYDMFGIRYQGHPDLKRILMWDGYPYYPLRKEFPLAGIETDLPAADVVEETHAKVIAAPMMGGPFHAHIRGKTMAEREPSGSDQSWSEHNPKPE